MAFSLLESISLGSAQSDEESLGTWRSGVYCRSRICPRSRLIFHCERHWWRPWSNRNMNRSKQAYFSLQSGHDNRHVILKMRELL